MVFVSSYKYSSYGSRTRASSELVKVPAQDRGSLHQATIKTLAHPFVHYGDASIQFDDFDTTTTRIPPVKVGKKNAWNAIFLRRVGMYMLHFISHPLHNCHVICPNAVYVCYCQRVQIKKNSSPIKKGALFVDVLDRQMCVVWRARAIVHFVSSRKMSKNENKVKSCSWAHPDDSRATHHARRTRRTIALHKPRPGYTRRAQTAAAANRHRRPDRATPSTSNAAQHSYPRIARTRRGWT